MAYDSDTRDGLLLLLHRLDRPEDEAVLAAARELAAKVKALDVDWDGLLVAAQRARPSVPLPVGDDAALIRLLLARDDLLADTRDDLEGFLKEAEAGELADEDRRYLHALNERLHQG
jgi:hypothetical protein